MRSTLQKLKSNKLFQLVDTLSKLGFLSLFRYGTYKVQIASGKLKKLTPISVFIHKPSYTIKNDINIEFSKELTPFFSTKIDEIINGQFRLFFDQPLSLGLWKRWRFYEEEHGNEHWSVSQINSIAGNDIKLTWDLSRFQWLMESSLAFRCSGNDKILEIIEKRVNSWCVFNPVNVGVNWVCAQECAIRMLHFIISTELLSPVCNQNKEFITEFVIVHLRRINASLIYSISQDNNHGVTESAALYIGALFLEEYTQDRVSIIELAQWRKKGKRFLVNRLNKLVLKDGGFAMYSVNYHRSILNLLVMVKVLEARYTKEGIGKILSSQAKKMTIWLEVLADFDSGDFPNIGTNDGSAPFLPQLSIHRSLKDTIDAANFVFNGTSRFNTSGELFYFLNALGVEGRPLKEPLKLNSCNFEQSGLMRLSDHTHGIKAFVKYPVYKFRPSQSDFLHVDVWIDGVNIAKDLGTYSYNCPKEIDYYKILSSISAHNTIQFGDYDAMPRLTKFLYSNWAYLEFQYHSNTHWHGAYITYFGAYHERKVSICENNVLIEDKIQSDCEFATLRWHVSGNDWLVDGNKIKSKDIELLLEANTELSITLNKVNESRYYRKLEPLICIEVLFKPQKAYISSTFKKLK